MRDAGKVWYSYFLKDLQQFSIFLVEREVYKHWYSVQSTDWQGSSREQNKICFVDLVTASCWNIPDLSDEDDGWVLFDQNHENIDPLARKKQFSQSSDGEDNNKTPEGADSVQNNSLKYTTDL